jgi:uncharacterized membrane protein
MGYFIIILILLGISATISPGLFVVLTLLIGLILIYSLIYKSLIKDFNNEEDKRLPEWVKKLLAAIGALILMSFGAVAIVVLLNRM